MRRCSALLFFVCVLFPFAGWVGSNAGQNAPSTIDDRAPFAIELPEIRTGLLSATTHTDIFIPPGSQVTRIFLWLLQPYDQRFGYDFKASLNNKALATVAQRRSGRHGNYLDIDLRQQPGLQMTAGKNYVEVVAFERESQLSYRCSFVLLPGVPQAARQPSAEIRFEQVLAHSDAPVPEEDRTAPQLSLTAPASPPDAPFDLRLAGYATDNSGVVSTIKVNGQTIASAPVSKGDEKKKKKKDEPAPPPPGERKLAFDQTIKVEARTQALLLEARDPTGNRALAYIPIRRVVPLANDSGFGGRRYAVIVGVSQYQFNEAGLTNLAFAHRDAEALRDFLRSDGGGAFKDEDIVCLTNDNATRAAVESEINRFLTKAGPNDLIYLFLGGHGAPDPRDPQKLYFLLSDSKVNDLPSTALPMSRIGDFLASKKDVRLVAFFDTCHSAGVNRQPLRATQPPKASGQGTPKGVVVRPKPGGGSQPAAPPQTPAPAPTSNAGFNFYNAALFREKGWTVISSSGMNELSQESAAWGGGHGVFTWVLLEGARGKADANRDCKITSAELTEYIIAAVRAATGNAQTPQTLPGGSRELVIAVLPGCSRGN
ncbi:MAG: caspase family protein [Blastocatellia bacterium]